MAVIKGTTHLQKYQTKSLWLMLLPQK